MDGCNAVLQLRPNETKALYRSGQAYRKLGRCREAAAALKEAQQKKAPAYCLFKSVCRICP